MPQPVASSAKTDTAPPASGPDAQKAEPTKDIEPQVDPPYRVLLHNDEVNLFDNVVRLLHRLTPLSQEEALLRTEEAHRHGKSTLLSTHKERAELYVEQLTSVSLTVTMEGDD